MAKVLILYYSSYGHIETMAQAFAEGVREVEGVTVDIKRVPETAPAEVVAAAHFKTDQAAPIATVDDLAHYDAIVIGAGTRYGRIPSQMAAFLDQTGPLWAKGTFNGKVGAAFTSTASLHGGQETTLMSIHTSFLHFGMVIVGLPYSYGGLFDIDAVNGGTPYGASTIAGGRGERQPNENELGGARHQGKLVAEITKKLHG
jgi:NAD(P)H dehydrogenase (quinone)